MTAATKPAVARTRLEPPPSRRTLDVGAPTPSERPRRTRPTPAVVAPTVLSVAVLAGAAFATPALRDAATGGPAADVALSLPTAYALLAPLCDTLDTLSLLSARQHIALVSTVLVVHLTWRVTRPGARRIGREIGRELGRELGALGAVLLAVVAVYAASLLPRPMAALRPADADVVTVDFHSHTTASWDGRSGFGAEENRAWHRAAGFDVAFVTDHRSFAGATAAAARNPRLAGDGTTLLAGVEARYRKQHLNALGGTARTGAPFLVGVIDPPELASATHALAPDAVLLLTVPSRLGEVPQVVAESGGAARAIELSDAAPRGLGQLDSTRARILRLADSLDLAVVAGSDNHGWGRTAAAWSLLTIPGWRRASPDSLSMLIRARIRQRGRRAVRVVERSRPHGSRGVALAIAAPSAVWTMFRQMRWPERASWLAWTWSAALVALVRRRQRAAGRLRGRSRVLRFGPSLAALALAVALPHARANAQTGTSPSAPPPATLGVRVTGGGAPLAGAVVRAGRVGALTDSTGAATLRVPAGRTTVIVGRAGFRPDTLGMTLPPAADTTIAVQLAPERAALAAVVVTSTRGTRRLEAEPERVEVLAGEDVGEKTVMRPANPTTLLAEVPGVRVQTTAPALGGAGVRVQGLRGRYTLLLADGLPLYGGASEGLGFLQIPTLDFAQAEVIKGAATALYGPAAAGGVLNLVSRRPPRTGVADRQLLLNATTRRGTDALLWSADRLSDRWGYTLLGGAHDQVATDVGGDRWADVPGFRRAELRPRFFWSGAGGGSAMLTAGGADEHRRSGTLGTGTIGGAPYRVAADTRRADLGAVAHFVRPHGAVLSVRASASQQWQDRRFGDSTESDRRGTAFAEATVARAVGARAAHQLLVGAGVQGDGLKSPRLPNAAYAFVTTSLFAQDTYAATDRLSLSATARLDHESRYGTFLSPRAALLFRLAPSWTARASGGAGVFAPTPLVEATEAVGLARVRGFERLTAERLRSASLDLTHTAGPLELNGTLFASRLAGAVGARENAPTAPGTVTLVNAPSPTRTGGAEFFATYNREPLSVTALYAYTRSTEWSPDKGRRIDAPLTPRHAAGLDVAFEEDESGTRVGIELFYTGRQPLEDDPYRTVSRPYTTVGLLAEQRVGRATVFANAENLTNVRQTRFDPLLLPRPSATGRQTTDAWAPLEGRTLNAGVRVPL